MNQSQSAKELADIKHALDEAAIVAITDERGRIIYVNDTFCAISRYPREELLGQDHRLINSGHHPRSFFEELWQTITQGRIWKGEIKNRTREGTFYWVDTTIVPFLDAATGKPYQYIAIRKDITYLKRIEEELRLMNEGLEARVNERTRALADSNQGLADTLEKLKESERMRETFVSALTHDLKTPLVAEQRALSLLAAQRDKLPEKFQGLTDRLIQNNAELLEMVGKLLEVYQFEAGKVRLLTENLSLYTLAEDCLCQLTDLAEGKSISLLNQIPADLRPLEGDAAQLRRVLINLVGNAIRHIPAGGAVTLEGEQRGETILLRVADNGPGIPADKLQHLFDRYFVAGLSSKKIGSGLGLSICMMIVRLHGGDIRVESRQGVGTVFEVALPCHQPVVRSPI
ncbi:MAG: ATP-binding protein [Candidatus Melainabacteria bacterium]